LPGIAKAEVDDVARSRSRHTSPYRDRSGRDTINASDEIFPTGGEPAVLELRSFGSGYLGVARLHLPAN
jgi:hypothetical protein